MAPTRRSNPLPYQSLSRVSSSAGCLTGRTAQQYSSRIFIVVAAALGRVAASRRGHIATLAAAEPCPSLVGSVALASLWRLALALSSVRTSRRALPR